MGKINMFAEIIRSKTFNHFSQVCNAIGAQWRLSDLVLKQG